MNSILWSLRRELWEHRWLWSVPLIAGAIAIAVFTSVVITQLVTGGANIELRISSVFDLASRILLITGTLVAFVYCAESLHGERRDRAILFWKTWPVGDVTAVGAKAIVPLIIVPAVTLALLIAADVIVRLVVIGKGIEVRAPMVNPLAATLEVIAAALWIAPVYAWIMLVSAWARRAVLLLAFIPMVLLAFVEIMLGRNAPIGHALFYRGVGRHWPMKTALDSIAGGAMIRTPAPELLRSLPLWGGVVVAALLLAVVVRLRRRMMVHG